MIHVTTATMNEGTPSPIPQPKAIFASNVSPPFLSPVFESSFATPVCCTGLDAVADAAVTKVEEDLGDTVTKWLLSGVDK